MEWDWSFVFQILPHLLQGVKVTIVAALLGFTVAVIFGLAAAIVRRAKNPFISRPLRWVLEFLRGTPLLVQLYFLFYVLARCRHHSLAARRRGDWNWTALRDLYRRGLPRWHRYVATRSVGGGQGVQSGCMADLAPRDPAASDTAHDPGARQLSRSDVQGDTASVGNYGA